MRPEALANFWLPGAFGSHFLLRLRLNRSHRDPSRHEPNDSQSDIIRERFRGCQIDCYFSVHNYCDIGATSIA